MIPEVVLRQRVSGEQLGVTKRGTLRGRERGKGRQCGTEFELTVPTTSWRSMIPAAGIAAASAGSNRVRLTWSPRQRNIEIFCRLVVIKLSLGSAGERRYEPAF
jgi:hypothetical protein